MANTEWYDKNHSKDPSSLQGRDKDGKFTTDTMGGGNETPTQNNKKQSFFEKSTNDQLTVDDEEELEDISEEEMMEWLLKWEKENLGPKDIDEMTPEEIKNEVYDLYKSLGNRFSFGKNLFSQNLFGDAKCTLANLRALEKISNEFPLKRKLPIESWSRRSGIYAKSFVDWGFGADIVNSSIKINRFHYSGSDRVISSFSRDINSGFHPKHKGTEQLLSGILVHEYGHAIFNDIFESFQNSDENFKEENKMAFRKSMMGDYRDINNLRKKSMKRRLQFCGEIMKKVKEIVGVEQYEKDRTRYGRQAGPIEDFPEVFSSYYSGEPTESSKILIEIIKEMRDKW